MGMVDDALGDASIPMASLMGGRIGHPVDQALDTSDLATRFAGVKCAGDKGETAT